MGVPRLPTGTDSHADSRRSGGADFAAQASSTTGTIIDRFSRRGLDNALSEIHLAATAFNLLKIHRATTT